MAGAMTHACVGMLGAVDPRNGRAASRTLQTTGRSGKVRTLTCPRERGSWHPAVRLHSHLPLAGASAALPSSAFFSGRAPPPTPSTSNLYSGDKR